MLVFLPEDLCPLSDGKAFSREGGQLSTIPRGRQQQTEGSREAPTPDLCYACLALVSRTPKTLQDRLLFPLGPARFV